jgi:YD repeat-containing protein
MQRWRAWCVVAAVGLSGPATVHCAEPPLDVFTDEQWQTTLLGLLPTPPRRVRHDQTLFDPRGGAMLSTQRVELGFDDAGRLAQASLHREPRGEGVRRHHWRYHYDDRNRIVRIDEEGLDRPALTRRFDAQGRLVEETRGEGVLTAYTRWRYDAAGREIERVESRAGGETVVRTRYRRDGSRERQTSDRGRLQSSDLRFDAQGRPIREKVRDWSERRTTTVEYPNPRRAVQTIVATGLSKSGAYRNERVLTFEVRTAEELLQWPEPATPELRAERSGRHDTTTRTEFDAQGRALRQLEARGQTLRCRNEFRYHASGLLESVTATRLDAPGPCPDGPQSVDFTIETDARGRWTYHVIHMTDASGQRVRMAEHRRQIEDR